MGFNCDYMAIQWDGINWVRFEHCQQVGNDIYVGARTEPRRILQTDQGRCRDMEPKTHVRYRIGDQEWICVLR